ncbi:MAG: NAD(P)-dependent oxidoreductase [bacterium]|nr:NAD(P)-dependent oxidoreductase [bacterium]
MKKRKKALITGGCGFLGRHFAKYLHKKGWDIVVVDDLSTGLHPKKWPEHLKVPFTFVKGDMRTYLERHKKKYDLAIHLAAVVGGRAVIEGKPALGAHSLELDASFFRWAAKEKPSKIVFMSSSAIYPVNLQGAKGAVALKESMVDFNAAFPVFGMPDLVYGWSKLSGEFLASTFAKHYGLNVFCPRPFSGYGEDQELSYPTPAICNRAVRREDPIVIWGSGKQTRDFIYVDDLIEAIISYLPKLKGYEAMNLGSGKAHSFGEVAVLAARYMGYKPKITNLQDKPEGVKQRYANVSKMRKHYTPKVSFEQGIKLVVEFLRSKHEKNARVD